MSLSTVCIRPFHDFFRRECDRDNSVKCHSIRRESTQMEEVFMVDKLNKMYFPSSVKPKIDIGLFNFMFIS